MCSHSYKSILKSVAVVGMNQTNSLYTNPRNNSMIQIRDDAFVLNNIHDFNVSSNEVAHVVGTPRSGMDDTIRVIGADAIDCFLKMFFISYIDVEHRRALIKWALSKGPNYLSPEKMAFYIQKKCKLISKTFTSCQMPVVPIILADNNTVWIRSGHLSYLGRNYGSDIYNNCSITLTNLRRIFRSQEQMLGIKLGFYSNSKIITPMDRHKINTLVDHYVIHLRRHSEKRVALSKENRMNVVSRNEFVTRLKHTTSKNEFMEMYRKMRYGQQF